MKVRIIDATEHNWYYDQVGEIFEVEDDMSFGTCYVKGDFSRSINTKHFVIMREETKVELEEELKRLKAQTEQVQKQLDEITRIPFTKAEYDSVMRRWRDSEGRVVFTPGQMNFFVFIYCRYDGHDYDPAIDIANTHTVLTDAFGGVFFNNASETRAALDMIGEENLFKAIKYELDLGM